MERHPFTERHLFYSICALLIIGCVLRTAQYAGAVSLWHDELALALNFQKYEFFELLTQPLDHKQVAPAGFLAAVKASTNILGINEYGLRFVPWLIGLVSIFLFWRTSHRFISGPVMLAGLSLFVISPALTWYGSSVKQYGIDVAATLLLILLSLRYLEHPDETREAILAGFAGAMALLFSHAAVFTGFVIGCILITRWYFQKPRTSLVPLAILCGIWAIGASITTVLSVLTLNAETSVYMREFWSSRGGFPPPVSQIGSYVFWFPKQLFSVFSHFLLFITPPVLVLAFATLPAAIAIPGVIILWRSSVWKTALLISPITAGILAAAFGLLPFRHRVGLYAGWPVLILSMNGILVLHNWLPGRFKLVARVLAFAMALPLTLTVLLIAPPPYTGQESRPVLTQVAQQYKTGDKLYAYCGAHYAADYYGPRLGLNDWIKGSCDSESPDALAQEVNLLRGQKRVWFFYTHSGNDKAQALKKHFESIGKELYEVPDPFRNRGEQETAAYLYDLSTTR